MRVDRCSPPMPRCLSWAAGPWVLKAAPVTSRILRSSAAIGLAASLVIAQTAAAAESIIRDTEIEADIRTMVTPIWKAAGLEPSSLHVYLVEDKQINSFVAGGQNEFINSGLIMRTETPNQLIGVMAHETGHIAGGHLARMQEELNNLSTMQILEALLGGGVGGPGQTGPGTKTPVPGSIMSFLKYSQTQEASADQASITFLQRTQQSP